MKRVLIALFVALVISPPAQAQLLRRIFGGGQRQQLQSVSCYTPTYQQVYQQQYVAVAAVPLATVPVAIDLQSYLYSVNAGAFQSFREYQSTKNQVAQQAPTEVSPPVQPVQSEDPRIAGASVLQKNCQTCHAAGKNPKSNFAIFDPQGNLYANLPLGEMLDRITSPDPETRMPPKKQLANHDVMSIFRLASSGLSQNQAIQTAAQPAKITSPWD